MPQKFFGEINNFYQLIPHWDTILHTINGFLCAGIGFSLLDLLNKNSRKIKLSPLYLAIFSFCFSMTIGVGWEFFEIAADMFLNTDMQKDSYIHTISTVELDETKSNKVVRIKDIDKTILYDKDGNELVVLEGYLDIGLYDTIQDLFVNLIGALTFSILGFFYTLNKKKYTFIKHFIPIRTVKKQTGRYTKKKKTED